MFVRWFKCRKRTPPRDVLAEARAAFDAGDYAAALAMWEPLARAGVAHAQNNIGACFTDGMSVERDPALAVRWLSPAAEAGDMVGRRNLATAYFKGLGVVGAPVRALLSPEEIRAAELGARQSLPEAAA